MKLSVTYSESFEVFLSKISAIQRQDPLKYTGYPKVHTFFRIYGVYFKESVLYSTFHKPRLKEYEK